MITQYQSKYEKDVEGGGGYVKIGPRMSDPTTFGDSYRSPEVLFQPFFIGKDLIIQYQAKYEIFNCKGKNVLNKIRLVLQAGG